MWSLGVFCRSVPARVVQPRALGICEIDPGKGGRDQATGPNGQMADFRVANLSLIETHRGP